MGIERVWGYTIENEKGTVYEENFDFGSEDEAVDAAVKAENHYNRNGHPEVFYCLSQREYSSDGSWQSV